MSISYAWELTEMVYRIKCIYHSANYIVVNKHWDIRIDSKMWYEKQTVQSQLKHRFPELADPGTYYGFRFCHQLDFSTSGALCVALNKAAAGQAYRCFKDRLVTKAYLALVRDIVAEEKMTLDFAIGKNTTEGKTHMMCTEGTDDVWTLILMAPIHSRGSIGCENPKSCQTELTVLEYGEYDGDPVTKVLLQPQTGRTHQLRVHCSAVGHPVVGDYTYSLHTDNAPYRMMLHAYFLHIPLENEPIHVTAPDPFVPTLDSKWAPQRCVNVLEDLLKSILTKPQTEIQEDPQQCTGEAAQWRVRSIRHSVSSGYVSGIWTEEPLRCFTSTVLKLYFSVPSSIEYQRFSGTVRTEGMKGLNKLAELCMKKSTVCRSVHYRDPHAFVNLHYHSTVWGR